MKQPKINASDSLIITKTGLLVVILIAVGAFLRLHDLGRMAYHHDESIHANYSFRMYKDGLSAWPYDPVYHGQLLYHLGAFFFFMFGDSDFTGRLPFACAGIFMLWLIWHARGHLGTKHALFALALAAFSPALTYFSRFARHDIYGATISLALFAFTLDYLKTRRASYFAAISFLLALLYANKEDSYVVGATFCGYLVLYGLYYVWSYPAGNRMRAWHTIVVDYNPLVKLLIFYFWFAAGILLYVKLLLLQHDWTAIARTAENNDLSRWVINSNLDHWLAGHTWFPWTYWCSVLLLAVISFALLSAFRRILERRFDTVPQNSGGADPQFAAFCRRNVPFLGGLIVMVLVYVTLFTNFGTVGKKVGSNAAALYDGAIDYVSYWMVQQGGKPRIANVPWYYLPQLGLYEFLPLLLSMIAYIVYLSRGWGILEMAGATMVLWSGLRILFRNMLDKLITNHWVNIPETVPPLGSMIFSSGILLVCGVILIVVGRFWPHLSRPWLRREEDPHTNPSETSPFDPDGLRSFLIFWALTSVVMYALLNEKVPWLLTHQALPLALLGGVFVGDLWKHLDIQWGRHVLLAAFIVLSIPSVRSNVILNFYSNDDPRELMVYTQAHPDITHLVKKIEWIAAELGRDYEKNIGTKSIAAVHDEGSWPLTWYLRNYKTTVWRKGSVPTPLPPIVISDVNSKGLVERFADGKYTVQTVKIRSWWPPYAKYWNPYHHSNDEYFQTPDANQRRWEALMRYLKYREVFSPTGSSDILVFIRTDLLPIAEDINKPIVPIAGEIKAQLKARWETPGLFIQPKGVALTRDAKNLLVLDSREAVIKVLDGGTGTIVRTIGGEPGSGKLTFSPYGGPNGGIAVGPEGNIYVTDTWGNPNRIVVYNPNGEFLTAWNQPAPGDAFYGPRGLTVDDRGRVYVTDTGNCRILVFEAPAGKLVQTIGSQGIAPSQLIEPVGITFVPPDELYVCDVGNRRIQVFGTDGSFRRAFSVPCWAPGPDGAIPIGIEPYVAVGPNGQVLISDSAQERIFAMDTKGGNVRELGGGLVAGPRGMTFGPNGMLFVAEAPQQGGGRVTAIQIE